MIVEPEDWGAFELPEGRLLFHATHVEFVPGQVEMPLGLCERFTAMLQSDLICGKAAQRPLSAEPANFDGIPFEERIPGMPGARRK